MNNKMQSNKDDIHWLIITLVMSIALAIQYQHDTGGNVPITKSDIRAIIIHMGGSLGVVFGAALFGLIAYFLKRRNGKPKRAFVITFIIIFTLSFLGSISRENRESKTANTSKGDQTIIDKYKTVQAFITIQESEGFTEDSMTIDALTKIDAWVKGMWVTKTNNYYLDKNINQSISENDIASKAVYMNIDGIKLAVLKMRLDTVRSVTILGFNNSVFKRVTCMRSNDIDIPLTYGPCANKIKEAFNVSLP